VALARRIQGLYFDAQAESLPEHPHHGAGAGRAVSSVDLENGGDASGADMM